MRVFPQPADGGRLNYACMKVDRHRPQTEETKRTGNEGGKMQTTTKPRRNPLEFGSRHVAPPVERGRSACVTNEGWVVTGKRL